MKISLLCSLFVICMLAVGGCVINFKSDRPPTQGIIHVDVAYHYPGKNVLSLMAGSGTYTKDIGPGRHAETRMTLDPGQQLLVLNKALVYHFFQMPDTFYHKGPISPSDPMQFLHIKADTLNKTIYWQGSTDDLQPSKFDPRTLIEYIDSIIKSTDEYQGLPEKKTL